MAWGYRAAANVLSHKDVPTTSEAPTLLGELWYPLTMSVGEEMERGGKRWYLDKNRDASARRRK